MFDGWTKLLVENVLLADENGLDLKTMFGELEPIDQHPAYRDRAARLRLLDEQGMEGALLFPTLGVGMQEAL